MHKNILIVCAITLIASLFVVPSGHVMFAALGLSTAFASVALSKSPDATRLHKWGLSFTGGCGFLGAVYCLFLNQIHAVAPYPFHVLVILGMTVGFFVPTLGFRLFHPLSDEKEGSDSPTSGPWGAN